MRREDKQLLPSQQSIPAVLDDSFESIIEQNEVTVFSLAMDLTGDDVLACEVVEEVFIALGKELRANPKLDVDRAIHRITYGLALAKKFSTPEADDAEEEELKI